MDKILDLLKINGLGYYGAKEDEYIVDISDSDEWGRYYSRLSKNEDLEESEEGSLLTVHNASIVYNYSGDEGDFQIILTADYDHDKYKLVVDEI